MSLISILFQHVNTIEILIFFFYHVFEINLYRIWTLKFNPDVYLESVKFAVEK